MQQQRASKKQQELLSFVDGFIKDNGYGPSYREIMNALGYKSVSTVAIHVDNLITKGYLARGDKSARSLEVVRMHDPTPTPPVAQSPKSFEQELEARIAAADLTPDERAVVQQALTLLATSLPVTTTDSRESKDA